LLDVSGAIEDDVVEIVWTEHAGPAADAPQFSEGFGSKLVQRPVAVQLGGSIYDWAEAGLVVRLRMKEDRLSA
jgi:two-component sensor histidine kinase